MTLDDAEVFVLSRLLAETGVQNVQEVIRSGTCVDRQLTGAGFLSSIRTANIELSNLRNRAVSKTFRQKSTGQLVLVDLMVVSSKQIDLEGAVVDGDWPREFDGNDLVELA